MPIINGLDRNQMTFSSLEDAISADNDVRFIDTFVDKLDLGKLGVTSLTKSEKLKLGRASYADSLLLKLYLYAYLNALYCTAFLSDVFPMECICYPQSAFIDKF